MKHKTLIENTFPLPLLLGYETSKPVPIVIATLLQRERVLTFHKCRKYREIGFWKPVLVAKFAENDPQMASKACLKDGKWTPQIPCPIGNHFSWGLGYFARQTKLKWTKNFKALFLSLTKYNGTVFWRFAPDMACNSLSYQFSYSIFGLRLRRVSKECYWSYEECQKLGK